MKKVYVAQTPQEAHLMRGLLESAGIDAFVQNENVFGLRGEVPMTFDTLPEVWVARDEDFERARERVLEQEGKRSKAPVADPETDTPAEDDAAPHEADAEPPRQRSVVGRVFRFLVVLLVGFVLGASFQNKMNEFDSQIDANDDGRIDSYIDFGSWKLKADRNFDGKNDETLEYDERWRRRRALYDNDFDGGVDTVETYKDGVVKKWQSFRPPNKHPVVEYHFQHGVLHEKLLDLDEDGDFDVTYRYDYTGKRIGEERLTTE